VLAIVLVLALILVLVLLRRRSRLHALAAWRHEIAPGLDAARLARSLLLAPIADVRGDQWRSVRDQVEQAARSLDRAATHAPTEEGTLRARGTAEALRGMCYAVEANVLLRNEAPTGQQLMEADAAVRARATDLDAALASLDAMVHPEGADARPPG
jgi:hypothetical protein